MNKLRPASKVKRKRQSGPSWLGRPNYKGWKPMRLCILFDPLGDWEAGNANSEKGVLHDCFLGRNLPKADYTLPGEGLEGFRKWLRDALPKDQILLVKEGALTRRAGNRIQKLRKAYILPSPDDLYDLLFHRPNQANKPSQSKQMKPQPVGVAVQNDN